MPSRHIGSRMLDLCSFGIFILLLWRISLWPEDLHTLWSALTCCNLSFFFGIVRRKRKFRKVRKFLAQLKYVSFKNLHKVWGIKNGTHLKVGHQWKIHNFCPILMKLCENDYLMRWSFSPSFMKIGQKMGIFYYWAIFKHVSCVFPQTWHLGCQAKYTLNPWCMSVPPLKSGE